MALFSGASIPENRTDDSSEGIPVKTMLNTLLKNPSKRQLITELLVHSNKKMQSPIKSQTPKPTTCDSPSALLRQRELEKMKNPTKPSRIEENRKKFLETCTAKPPIPFNQLLKDVVAFVEMRTREGDKSSGAKLLMKSMGATIVDKIHKNVTHIIYKDGSYTTFCKARILKLPLTSVLWLDAMRTAKCRLPAEDYPALCNYDVDLSRICEDLDEQFQIGIREDYNKSKRQTIAATSSNASVLRISDIMTDDETSQSSTNTSADVIPPSLEPLEDKYQHVTLRSGRKTPQANVGHAELSASHAKSRSYDQFAPSFVVPSINKRSMISMVIQKTGQASLECNSTDSTVPSLRLSKSSVDVSTAETNVSSVPSLRLSKSSVEMSNEIMKPSREVESKCVDSVQTAAIANSENCIVPSLRISESPTTNDTAAADGSFKKPQKLARRSGSKSKSVSCSSLLGEESSTDSQENLSGSDSSKDGGRDSFASSRSSFPRIDEPAISNMIDATLSAASCAQPSPPPRKMKNMRKLYNPKCHDYHYSQPERSEAPLHNNHNTVSTKTTGAGAASGGGGGGCSMAEFAINLSYFMKNKRVSLPAPRFRVKTAVQHVNFLSSSTKTAAQSLAEAARKAQEKTPSLANEAHERTAPPLKKINAEKEPETTVIAKRKPGRPSGTGKKLKTSVQSSTQVSGKCVAKSGSTDTSTNTDTGIDKNVERQTRKRQSPCSELDVVKTTPELKRKVGRPSLSTKKVGRPSLSTKKVGGPSLSTKKAGRASLSTKKPIAPSKLSKDRLNSATDTTSDASDCGVTLKRRSVAQKALNATANAEKRTSRNGRQLQSSSCSESDEKTKRATLARKEEIAKRTKIVSPALKRTVQRVSVRIKKETSPKLSKMQNSSSESSSPDSATGKASAVRKSINPACRLLRSTENKDKRYKKCETSSEDTETENEENSRTRSKTQPKNASSDTDSSCVRRMKRDRKAVVKSPLKAVENSTEPKAKRYSRSATELAAATRKVERIERSSSDTAESSPVKTPKQNAAVKRKLSMPAVARNGAKSENALATGAVTRRSTLEFAVKKPKRSDGSRQAKRKPKTKGGIVCSKFTTEEALEFQQNVERLGRFAYEDRVTKNTTHLVIPGPYRTVNLLKAIARGCWILRADWVEKSLQAGKWVDEEDYELVEIGAAVEKCRTQRHVFGSLFCMDLFKNCGAIYISKKCNPPCADLKKLVTLCGGKVLQYPTHRASVVVGEKSDLPNVTCVTEAWLLDSVVAYATKSLKRYIIR